MRLGRIVLIKILVASKSYVNANRHSRFIWWKQPDYFLKTRIAVKCIWSLMTRVCFLNRTSIYNRKKPNWKTKWFGRSKQAGRFSYSIWVNISSRSKIKLTWTDEAYKLVGRSGQFNLSCDELAVKTVI